MAKTIANNLTNYCLTMLSLNGFYVWRQNNVGVFDPTKKIYRANNTKRGVPDILGFHKKTGKFICVEIKAGNDKLNKYQEEFLESAKSATAYCFVVKKIVISLHR